MATASPKAEVQARIWPRHFIGGRTADTLTGDGKEEDLRLLEGLSGETAALPLECSGGGIAGLAA